MSEAEKLTPASPESAGDDAELIRLVSAMARGQEAIDAIGAEPD